ncbi:MAG: heme exporter protein CcmB [Leptonema sp. (in: bacteria)]
MSIKYFFVLVLWEFKIHFKSFQSILILFFYAVSLTVVYHYSLREEIFLEEKNFYGLFLISIFFMVILLSGRSLQREKEAGAYKMILISPLPRYIFYLTKVLTKSLIILLIVFFYQFIYKILLIGQIELGKEQIYLILFITPAIVSLTALGEIISLMSTGNKMRELVLPILFFPLSLPVYMIFTSLLNEYLNSLNDQILNFFFSLKFVLPIILSLIYVLMGILFFSNLSIEET